MDAEEWQRLADRIAAVLGAEVSALEQDFWPEPRDGSFRAFWPRVRELNERVRIAPAIKLDDKLALQHRLNELCQRARRDQKVLQQRVVSQKQELLDAVAIASASVEDAHSIDELQEVRRDLSGLRERIAALDPAFRREERQDLWNAWQIANQSAWERLNRLWGENERVLSALLDEAQESLRGGEPRAAKDRIKAFHAAVTERECAHRTLRALRARANGIWRDADELSRQKHAAYLSNVGKRVQHWRSMREKNERTRFELARQISELEARAAAATTDVGAALVRGHLAERRRTLAEIEAADRDLARQIDAAELALSQP
jgi:hypothetical protein